MYQSHKRFTSVHGKRLVLIVDDEEINREILGVMLSDEYDLLFAENGREALELVRANASLLSAILLDVLMPEMDGFAVLEVLKSDVDLRRIPVIVLTTEKDFEVKALRLGAADFITKPYDLPEVVQARVDRCIELSEDTVIIQGTERDELTGLYNPDFFFQYSSILNLF